MSANLFKNDCSSCLGPDALDELQCLGISVKDTSCTPENSAPYYEDFQTLLQSYPVFTLDLPLNSQGLLFNFQDRALFIEEGGHKVTLCQANYGIFTFVQALTPGAWLTLAKFSIQNRYDIYTLFDLYTRHRMFDGELITSKWYKSDSSWDSIVKPWNKVTTNKTYLYKSGETFLTLSPCQETMSLYFVLNNVSVSTYEGFRTDAPYWKKVTSIQTGFNKCLGCDRAKHPADLYDLIEIGSKGHKVEAPRRYTPSAPTYERQSLK